MLAGNFDEVLQRLAYAFCLVASFQPYAMAVDGCTIIYCLFGTKVVNIGFKVYLTATSFF